MTDEVSPLTTLRRVREAIAAVEPAAAEIAAPRPGDGIVAGAEVVMDRAFTIEAPAETVWPWFVQLGKRRAGWYLPRSIERLMPAGRRALRRIDPTLQGLAVGDVIPDWGGRDESFEVARLEPPKTLVHTSRRGRTKVSWAICLEPVGPAATRVTLRLRLAPVRRRRLVETVGEAFDRLTVAGLAAGLRERVGGE